MKKYNRLWTLLFIMAIFLFVPIKTQAKTLEANLENDYTNCLFKLSFENEGIYNATIKSPDGKSYNFQQADDKLLTCEVPVAEKGKWLIEIKNGVLNDDTQQKNDEESSNDKTIVEKKSSDDIIGKVTVSVSIQKESTPSDKNTIKIGRDISGLKVYLKNDSLISEWTDESCGNVVIKVINLDNSETLANEDIGDERFFELPLKETVKNISVTIVPKDSVRVDGAERKYVIYVSNHPRASVTYPESGYTNQETIPVAVHMDDCYGIYVTNNDSCVLKKDLQDPGDYTFDVPIKNEGDNNISFYIVDENGNMRSTDKTIIKDTVVPVLTLAQEYDGVQTYNNTYDISGSVSDFSLFTINGESIEPTTDGHFSYTCSLHIGDNLINLQASDLAGNITEYNIHFTMNEKEKKDPLPIIIATALFIFAIIIFCIVNKKKSKKKSISKNSKLDLFDEIEEDEDSDTLDVDEDTLDVDEKREDLTSKKGILNSILSIDIKKIKKCRELICCGIVSVIAIIIFGFIIQISPVKSGSMEPFIVTGDIGLFSRLSYNNKVPERGDVVYYFNKESGKSLCKRVIALEGEKVTFADGYVFINGAYLDESEYISDYVETNCNKTFTVPEGCCFTLGDNREQSFDSRYMENPYIKYKDIKSKLLFVLPTHNL